MSYKIELHCHTDFSGCSNVPAVDAAEKYINAGYSTLVITNHFTAGYRGEKPHAQITREMFAAAEEVRQAAGDRLRVLTGMELTFRCMPNDFLVYGLTEEQIAAMEDVFDLQPWQMHNRVRELGGLMIQAHPFRFGQTVVNPADVDGVEVYNGHSGHHSHNDIARMWALSWAEHFNRDFILTSGTDHHDASHRATGGIVSETPVTTNEELIALLCSHKYLRITTSLGEKDY